MAMVTLRGSISTDLARKVQVSCCNKEEVQSGRQMMELKLSNAQLDVYPDVTGWVPMWLND